MADKSSRVKSSGSLAGLVKTEETESLQKTVSNLLVRSFTQARPQHKPIQLGRGSNQASEQSPSRSHSTYNYQPGENSKRVLIFRDHHKTQNSSNESKTENLFQSEQERDPIYENPSETGREYSTSKTQVIKLSQFTGENARPRHLVKSIKSLTERPIDKSESIEKSDYRTAPKSKTSTNSQKNKSITHQDQTMERFRRRRYISIVCVVLIVLVTSLTIAIWDYTRDINKVV